MREWEGWGKLVCVGGQGFWWALLLYTLKPVPASPCMGLKAHDSQVLLGGVLAPMQVFKVCLQAQGFECTPQGRYFLPLRILKAAPAFASSVLTGRGVFSVTWLGQWSPSESQTVFLQGRQGVEALHTGIPENMWDLL